MDRNNYISQDELDNDYKVNIIIINIIKFVLIFIFLYLQLDPSQQYFDRVNTNRRSSVKDYNMPMSVSNNNNNTTKQTIMFNDQIFKVKLNKSKSQSQMALGIHVIPTYDLDSQK